MTHHLTATAFALLTVALVGHLTVNLGARVAADLQRFEVERLK